MIMLFKMGGEDFQKYIGEMTWNDMKCWTTPKVAFLQVVSAGVPPMGPAEVVHGNSPPAP